MAPSRILIFLCLGLLAQFRIHAEETAKMDSITPKVYHISGSALITNNGISLLPMFNLGKPAAIFDLSIGNDRISYEQQLRYSLAGKPWSFIFWTRW